MRDLSELRQHIDKLDKQLVDILAERFRATEEVGEYKAAHNLPAIDTVREAEQEKKITELAKQAGLDPEIAKKVLRTVIDLVVRNHQEIALKLKQDD